MKKTPSFSIDEEILKKLDRVSKHLKYRSKSSIVQEALEDWLKRNKEE